MLRASCSALLQSREASAEALSQLPNKKHKRKTSWNKSAVQSNLQTTTFENEKNWDGADSVLGDGVV
jgi:hypothetical protein